MKLQAFFDRAAFAAALILALGGPANIALAAGGGTYYVDAVNGDNKNDGSAGSPWQSITHGLNQDADVLMVASGNYGIGNGEVFPLLLPDKHDFTLQGPGDGSAIIDRNSPPDPGGSEPSMKINSNGNTVTVDGMRFEEVLSPDPGWEGRSILIQGYGAGQINVSNNEFLNGLFGVYAHIHGNLGILVENNTLSGQGDCAIELQNHSGTSVSFVVRGNSINAAEDGIEVRFSVTETSSESVTGFVAIENNTITGVNNQGVDLQITLSESATESCTANVVAIISNNTVTDAGDGGIQLVYYDSGESASNVGTVNITVDNNTVTNSSGDNIDGEFWVSYYWNSLNLDLTITNNTSTGAADDGLDLTFIVSDQYSYMDATVLIAGNTISDNADAGIELEAGMDSYTTSAEMHIDILARNNAITGNPYGLFLSSVQAFYSSYSSMELDFSLDVQGNTITGADYNGVFLYLGNSTSGRYSLTGNYSLTLNNNTIQGNAVAGDADLSSSFELSSVGSGLIGSVDATNNFWGTQDAAAIADRVWDGVDDGDLVLVDHSSARPDVLSFTVDVVAEQMVITADDDGTGFVAYAGNTSDATGIVLAVTVGGAAVDPKTVAVETGVLTIFPVPDGLSDGDEVCVTNPGGQSGCGLFESGGGGPNTAPHANYDGVETPNGAAITIDVVANDTDAEDNIVAGSVVITQAPHKGTAVNNGDGTVTYTPDAGRNTSDTFNYTVADSGGLVSNIATVAIQTTGGGGGGNSAPAAIYDSETTSPQTAVTIDVVANDTDADGNLDPSTVTITQAPHKGTAVNNGDGTVTYTPSATTSGTTDTFNYTVSDTDGATSNIATVEVRIEPGDDNNLGGSGPPKDHGVSSPPGPPGP